MLPLFRSIHLSTPFQLSLSFTSSLNLNLSLSLCASSSRHRISKGFAPFEVSHAEPLDPSLLSERPEELQTPSSPSLSRLQVKDSDKAAFTPTRSRYVNSASSMKKVSLYLSRSRALSLLLSISIYSLLNVCTLFLAAIISNTRQ